ncbi:hypothetical protein SOD10_39840 [Serratia plymuthica]|nr:hypothetical protein SOD10_39840 [Serratia plymuthica]
MKYHRILRHRFLNNFRLEVLFRIHLIFVFKFFQPASIHPAKLRATF